MDVPNNDYGDYLQAMVDRDKACCQWYGCPEIATQCQIVTKDRYCDRHAENYNRKLGELFKYEPINKEKE